MKQLTDVQAFQQSPLPKPSRNPQYMYRADGIWFIREHGTQTPMKLDEAVKRLGHENAMVAADLPGNWIELDNDPRAENAVPELLPFGNSDDVSQTTIEERMLFAAVVPVLAVIASMERRAR